MPAGRGSSACLPSRESHPMKLLYSSTSPYSAKVRMAARYAGIAVEAISVKTDDQPEILIENNPLGKIPVLIPDNGKAVYDSVAIMQFLNRQSKGKLYPRAADRRTEADVLEALCDGITDCLIAIIYEQRFRPAELVHQPWIDSQWQKAQRGLDFLEANLPKTAKTLHGGHFALAALIGYLELRFAGKWEKGRAKLKKWPQKFEKFFPDYQAMKPQV
jgi:glutathione S-transferase